MVHDPDSTCMLQSNVLRSWRSTRAHSFWLGGHYYVPSSRGARTPAAPIKYTVNIARVASACVGHGACVGKREHGRPPRSLCDLNAWGISPYHQAIVPPRPCHQRAAHGRRFARAASACVGHRTASVGKRNHTSLHARSECTATAHACLVLTAACDIGRYATLRILK